MQTSIVSTKPADFWSQLADRVLSGTAVSREEALAVLSSHDAELLDVLAGAYRIRRRYFANTVQLYFLMNAKSGLCPEDCGYCSQSKVADAGVEKYRLLDETELLAGARRAAEKNVKTYCLVISGRAPTEKEMEVVTTVVPKIKAELGLNICACLGLLTEEQAVALKNSGVDKVNHNLNTSEEYYSQVCTTHTYADRLNTLKAAKSAGLDLCSGGIVGMGETHDDVVSMAFELAELDTASIPINFLNAIPGTPLAGVKKLNPRDCLRTLAMFRFVNPKSEIRIAGGRELHLRTLQPLGLYAANSIFVGDYLTTKGQPPKEDYRMITDLGFVITKGEERTLQGNGDEIFIALHDEPSITAEDSASYSIPVLTNRELS